MKATNALLVRATICSVLFSATLVFAAPKESDAGIERCRALAQTCNDALVSEDYATFAKCTHPKVVKALGGPEGMAKFLRSGREKMRTEGADFLSGTVEAPSELIPAGKLLVAILPTTITMKVPGGKLVKRSHLIGISRDRGRHWTFIDREGLNADNLKQFVPGLPARVQLPDRQEAVFEPLKSGSN